MAKVIIGIHGLSNKPDKETLADWWEKAIREGLAHNCKCGKAKFKFVMVYWADLLYRHCLHQDKNFNFDSHYNNEPYYKANEKNLTRKDDNVLHWARGHLSEMIGTGIDAFRRKTDIQWLTAELLRKKLKDLDFYWDEKRKIRGRDGKLGIAKDVLQAGLIDAIRQHAGEGTELMLIAHSMGSIISYDVLRDLGRGDDPPTIPYYVTIGSPLGLPLVKSEIELERWDKKVRTPSIVTKRWVNFADPRDPVAVDFHLHDDFKANDAGVRVEDDLIQNDYKIKGEANHHKSYGYLRAPEVPELICEFLKQAK
jgi:hypothetical protein